MVAIRFIPKHPQQTDYIRDIQGIYTKIGWQRKLTIEMRAIKSSTRQKRNEHSGMKLGMTYKYGNSNSTTKSISPSKHTRRGNMTRELAGRVSRAAGGRAARPHSQCHAQVGAATEQVIAADPRGASSSQHRSQRRDAGGRAEGPHGRHLGKPAPPGSGRAQKGRAVGA